jgi:limonene-1,2-epoxide hydrolase
MAVKKSLKAITKLQPLTTDLILELWSRTYNTQGKPDWSHIFPYYHESIVFQDTIQRVEGKEAFVAMCNRLAKRCEQLNMDILSIAANPPVFFMEWKMTMIFRKTPSTPIFGCTKLTLGENGQIILQRDYYDLWGDIFKNVPMMKTLYPRFMQRLFG